MFTGIIEAIAPVKQVSRTGNAVQVDISRPASFDDLREGASIACNGICLTVTSFSAAEFKVELMAETLGKSNARYWKTGTRLNLERALKSGGRLDGHWVQGHVDRTAPLLSKHTEHGTTYLRFGLHKDDSGLVVPQGSIAINGVSLTIARLNTSDFCVALISHTLANSNLNDLHAGDEVNLEYDIVGKYILRQKEKSPLSMEWLHEQGF